jgi:error-prone DNA polymerase
MSYAELHCLSNFTFLRGASHPEELVERAQQLGYSAIAVTDECSLAGVVRAHEEAKKCNFKLLIGSEFRLADGLRFVLLATDREGYGNLAQLITQGRRKAVKGSYYLTREDLSDGVPGCLALWLPNQPLSEDDARWLAKRFAGRLWIAVEMLLGADDEQRLGELRELSRRIALPLVACGDVHMHVRKRRALQDTLTAIRLRRPLRELGYELHPNAERFLRPLDMLAKLYPPELLAETLSIVERCNFSLDSLRYEYPEELVPPGETPSSYLRKLTEEGLDRRFPLDKPGSKEARVKCRPLIEHELKLIAEQQYEPFFLTVYDIVRFARSEDILCQGRGSAANSVVCYCLGITEVDPSHMDMLFERFISKERKEPPDIDVDFEHQRREEVMQYVYKKYGRERAAIAATVITYRSRSALRDVGKALGLDLGQVDRLAKSMAWWDNRETRAERLREAGFDPHNPLLQHMSTLVNTLIGFPRHLSQHTGGFVISRGPLSRLVPIENAAMVDRTIIQWDKDDLDALGLLKVDVLALGMLSCIRRALELFSVRHGKSLTMAEIPQDDPAVYEMICKADTIGVFQIESRAQMAMLPRLRPQNYYDLVIEVAIVRPGPIQGGMVHPYLRRRQKLEAVDYPSEKVKGVLERTMGVPIFQEQVMQLAVVAAGFTPGEADQLRRSMAAWKRKGGLEKFEAKLIDGMHENGYSEAFAHQIFEQIKGFGEYGFPESHSASFALLVYISSWIKHYEPAIFACALLNAQPLGFYSPSQIVQDARRHEVEVRAADVTVSDWECTLEFTADREPALRLGLCLVKGLSKAGGERLVAERQKKSFASVHELAVRARLNAKDLNALAAAGSLATLTGHRRNALWEVSGIELLPPLLADAPIVESVPALSAPSEGEDLIADYASLGLTLGRHPLALLRPQLASKRMATAIDLKSLPHGRPTRVTGLVTGRQRPGTSSGVIFVTLEDETGMINVVVWNDLAVRQQRELLGSRLMEVHGRLEREGEVTHLIAARLADRSQLLGDLMTKSRDFH